MFRWLKSLFSGMKPPEPAGPPQTIKTFGSDDRPIGNDARWEEGELRVHSEGAGSIRLFEVPMSDREQCMITYRFTMRTEDVSGGVYPELWCRIPGRGEFFSKGLNQKVRGTNDWSSFEVPFYLRKGQRPDLIKLNVAFEGSGKVRVKDMELLVTPLKG